MNNVPQASVIVGSYNQRRTLEFLLESLERQTFKDFEVIVADDGSTDGTAGLCSQPRQYPVKFLTQTNMGFRKSKILNQGIRAARAPYLVFIDSDTIEERHFVEDHMRLRQPGAFVCGRRVELGPRFSEAITVEKVRRGMFNGFNFELLKSVLKRDSESFNRSMRVTNPLIRKIFQYDMDLDILGCNFSVWKEDIIAINGFNESMETYWGEDGDLYIRLRNSGKKAIGVKAVCVQFHVFHPRREALKENMDQYYSMLKNTEYKWAKLGLTRDP